MVRRSVFLPRAGSCRKTSSTVIFRRWRIFCLTWGCFLWVTGWVALAGISLAGDLVCSGEKLPTASMLPEIKTKRPNVSASGRFFSLTATDASSAVGQHFVDQTILGGFVGGQEAVAIRVFGDLFHRLARAFGHDAVQAVAQVEDFLGLDFDVRRHALRTTGRLVDHDARVR